jgi:hypothetical protein
MTIGLEAAGSCIQGTGELKVSSSESFQRDGGAAVVCLVAQDASLTLSSEISRVPSG